MIRAEIKKCIFSFEMLITVILSTICFIFGVSERLRLYFAGEMQATIYYMYDTSIFAGIISVLLPILAVLPIVNILISENSSGYGSIVMLRTTRTKYIIAKIVAAIVSGMFAIAAASILFIIVLKFMGINFVLSPPDINFEKGITEGSIYFTLIKNGMPQISVCLRVLGFALETIPWTMMALVLSRYIKNKYALIIIPFLTEKLLIFICYPFDFLFYFSPLTWGIGSGIMMYSALGGLVYELIVQGIIITVGSLAFSLACRRNYRYG